MARTGFTPCSPHRRMPPPAPPFRGAAGPRQIEDNAVLLEPATRRKFPPPSRQAGAPRVFGRGRPPRGSDGQDWAGETPGRAAAGVPSALNHRGAGKRALPQWTHGRGPPDKTSGVLAPCAPAHVCASPPRRISSRGLDDSAGSIRATGTPSASHPGVATARARQPTTSASDTGRPRGRDADAGTVWVFPERAVRPADLSERARLRRSELDEVQTCAEAHEARTPHVLCGGPRP